MQRQFCIGEPPALQKRLVEISEIGEKAAEKMFKQGIGYAMFTSAAMSVIGKFQMTSRLRLPAFTPIPSWGTVKG